MSKVARKPRLQLRLYIAGRGIYATTAQQNIESYARTVGIEYDLEVVDLRIHPERAPENSVVVTPTLVRLSPPPRAMLIGDLADHSKLAAALGMGW